METWFTPSKPSALPAAKRVLVLAPHPDDEIFGCGGSLALLRQAGAEVLVHVLTDGAGNATDAQRETITRTRQAETNAALDTLDLPHATFAKLADRGLANFSGLAEHILKAISQHKADLVFAPSLSEIHPDHLATSRAVCAAAEKIQQNGGQTPTLFFYEIGSPLRPDLIIDITMVWSLKHQAMQCFPSQLAQQDYLRHISALNTYRTYTLPANTQYAEAFSTITPAQLGNIAVTEQATENYIRRRWIDTALAAADAQAEILHAAAVRHEDNALKTSLILGSTQQEVRHLQQELRQAQLQQQALLDSSSWRLTAPLRWLARHLRHRV